MSTFKDRLTEHQKANAREALMRTVCEQPEQSIGEIWSTLEEDSDGDFIMFDLFKKLTVEELVTAAAPFVNGKDHDEEPAPVAFASDEDEEEDDEEEDDEVVADADDEEDDDDEEGEDEDEDEDEDEFVDEEEDEDEDEEDDEEDEEEEPKRRAKRKGAPPPKGKKKGKRDKDVALDLSGEKSWDGYKSAILKCLKKNKARNEKTAMSSADIRKEVNGDATQARDALNELIEDDRVTYCGKARGTKYYLA